MNSFDSQFFKKYLPESVEIEGIVHKHILSILDRLIVMFSLFVFIPSLIYYMSYRLKDAIPFYFFEAFMCIMFIKIVYDIFDWYCDTWLITSEGIYDIKWKLFKSKITSVNYENIEGVEVVQNGIIDKIFKKGTIIIHKIGDDEFRLDNAMFPLHAADEIETKSNSKGDEEEDDRFDMIMDTLSGVVEDYLERKGLNGKDKKKEEENHHIERIKRKKGSIDLS